MELYVGMDVHSKECVFAVQDQDGRLVGEGRIPTSYEGLEGLRDRCRLPAGTRVALETGEMAFVVAKWLMLLDLVPVVVDAREVRMKAYRPSQKSDRRDALELCEGLRRGQYRGIVHVPPREIQKLRGLLSHRRHFVRIKTRQVNAAKQVVRVAGLGHLVASLDTDEAWQKFRKRLDFATDLQDLVDCHYFGWLNAHEQVGWLETRIDDLLQQHFAEPAKRLQQVFGVGPIVALTVIAAVSDPRRFPTAKHVASYAGIVPCTYQSADRDYQGHITKKGSPELRAMLCEAAHHAARSDHPFNPFFAKVASRQGYKAAIVAIAHKLLRVLWAMLRTGEDFDLGRLGIEEGDFKRVIRKKYRLKPLHAPRRACLAKAG